MSEPSDRRPSKRQRPDSPIPPVLLNGTATAKRFKRKHKADTYGLSQDETNEMNAALDSFDAGPSAVDSIKLYDAPYMLAVLDEISVKVVFTEEDDAKCAEHNPENICVFCRIGETITSDIATGAWREVSNLMKLYVESPRFDRIIDIHGAYQRYWANNHELFHGRLPYASMRICVRHFLLHSDTEQIQIARQREVLNSLATRLGCMIEAQAQKNLVSTQMIKLYIQLLTLSSKLSK